MKIREIILDASAIPDEPVVAALIVLALGLFLGIEFLVRCTISNRLVSVRHRR